MDEVIVKRKFVLCEDGLENLEKDGKPVGFSFCMRIPEYRGLPLALIGGFKVSVDGVEYPESCLSLTAEGETFAFNEIDTVTTTYWLCEEPLIITVNCGKLLEKGPHKVAAYAYVRISYMPFPMYAGEELTLEIK